MANSGIKSGAKILSALANEKRLMIVSFLLKGEKSVNQLVEEVGVSQSSLSQHLAVLRREKILKTRREAQTIYYSVSCPKAIEILETVGISTKSNKIY